ncbi:MAG: hypothetical protein GIS02_05970 [Methanosarcinales archaeon]|uniref:Uncharacterized protein n=1 Tax=Candidatus Ethanoperedens thermophilum TaxID=2766897 RepID=A0A848DAF0_9EURY|nr:hypothetical protein [Candidatus Ethanoperedens thermophilum]
MEIDVLERLNKLPKIVASPEMDLEKLKGIAEYIRKQWWDKISRDEAEYLTRFVSEGETNGFLEANMAIITAYIPNPTKWEEDMKTRR